MPGRGNGLDAASYTPLAELEPQLADAMLDAFREEGVAAYAEPVPGRGAGDIMARPYSQPLDRLFVDAAAVGEARRILDDRLAELRQELSVGEAEGPLAHDDPSTDSDSDREGPSTDPGVPPAAVDEEAAFERIVSGFDASPDDPVPRWPVAEDLDDRSRGQRPPREVRDGEDHEADSDDEPAAREDDAPSGTPAAQDEDHFVPPPPPPLPQTDLLTKLAWTGLLGGPGYFLVAFLLGWHVGTLGALLGIGAFVGGFIVLVARMNDRPPTDSGPDDGAVV